MFSAVSRIWQQQLRLVQSGALARAVATTSTAMADSRLSVQKPISLRGPLQVPGGTEGRLLLGPGPSNCSPRVREALSRPLLGHMHPEFLQVMDEAKEGLRYLFQTRAPIVCCISGTGHSGMEGMICNLLEEGEVLLVADTGIWGQRAAEMARRQGVEVRVLAGTVGGVVSRQQLEESLRQHSPSLVLLVHAESSTGALQPLQGLGELCHRYGALLCVDAVASAGGVPLLVDDWQVDAVYTGTQKVLSAPPGLAPCALSHRAREKLLSRKSSARSYYMDLLELANYWGCDDQPRRYHHTGPITSVYGLREAVAALASEGLSQSWARHRECSEALYRGLEGLGLELLVVDKELRAPTVTTVKVPPGVDWKKVTGRLMNKHQIEISGGLGPTAGKVWRIGLMGHNCTLSNVDTLLLALKEALVNGSNL